MIGSASDGIRPGLRTVGPYLKTILRIGRVVELVSRLAWSVRGGRLKLKQGDITRESTDAVVNAANKRLAPGGGVAGAIHRAAGDELREHCRKLGGCETGEAVITPGFDLDAPYIIHTVGPVYRDHPNPEEALRRAYRNSLKLAEEEGLRTVSFPALSTGAFGYPYPEAAEVAVDELTGFLESSADAVEEVRMVLFSDGDREEFERAARERLGEPDEESGEGKPER